MCPDREYYPRTEVYVLVLLEMFDEYSISGGICGISPQHTTIEDQTMNGDTQIYISGREYKVPSGSLSYEQVVEIWNKLHEPEGKHIVGTPGIDYDNSLRGSDGVLLPGQSVEIKDGTSFSVDPEHVS